MYKNYRTCPICEQEFPLTRIYFKRLVVLGEKEAFHTICKECEKKIKREKEWKEGKLLCHCCGIYKDENDFTPNGNTSPARNGRKSICKNCDCARQRNRDINLKDAIKLRKCMNSRFLAARDRANKHNIPFDITLDYLMELWDKQKGMCALSGIEMTFELKMGRTHTNVSIDKIDRTKGYTVGNVQLVCMACNQIKSDMTEEAMYYFCKNIVEQYENKNKESTAAS